MNWKDRLKKVDELVGSSNGAHYDRLVLLRQVLNDRAYKTDCRSARRTEFELLEGKVADIAMSLSMLFAMLDEFPQRKQWECGRLYDMQLKVASKVTLAAKLSGKKTKTKKIIRHAATLAQVRGLEEEKKADRAKIKYLEKEVENLQQQLVEKTERNEKLEAKVEQLQNDVSNLIAEKVTRPKWKRPVAIV